MGALDSTCGMKADPACRWLPIVMDHFPPVKWHPKKYRCWEGDDERNTGHLGKKKCFINSVGKRERVLSQTESLQVSSSFDSTVGQCDEWASQGRERRPHSLTAHTQNNISTVLHQINPPGSVSFVRMHSVDHELQNTFNSKGWKLLPGIGEGAVLGAPATYSRL